MKNFVILLAVAFCSIPAFAAKWQQHDASIKMTVVKIKTLEETRDKLIHEKEHTRDNKRLDGIIAELTNNHKELEKAYDEFSKEQEHIRFEHPEQGDSMERKYRRFRLKSVEEREEEMGLDGKLNAIKAKMDRTYGNNKPKPSPSVSSKPNTSK